MGIKQGLNVSGGFCETFCELFDPTVSNTNMVAAWTGELQTTLMLLPANNLSLCGNTSPQNMQCFSK